MLLVPLGHQQKNQWLVDGVCMWMFYLRKILLLLWIFSRFFRLLLPLRHNTLISNISSCYPILDDQRRSSEKKFEEFSWPFSTAMIDEWEKRYHGCDLAETLLCLFWLVSLRRDYQLLSLFSRSHSFSRWALSQLISLWAYFFGSLAVHEFVSSISSSTLGCFFLIALASPRRRRTKEGMEENTLQHICGSVLVVAGCGCK